MVKNIGLGIMSGSSLDGLDLALCSFKAEAEEWDFEFLKTATIPFPKSLKHRLSKAHSLSGEELIALDVELGKWIGDRVNGFLEIAEKPSFLALHGHTVFHKPELGYSLQIGSANHIAAVTKTTVVSDFRQLNIAFGGQGAPLVPLGDLKLFKEYSACLNLGGISNVSIQADNKMLAWDIAPCNQVFDHLAQAFGKKFDKDGVIALSGSINNALLQQLDGMEYYQLTPPKSLGNHWVKEVVLPLIDGFDALVQDKMKTFQIHLSRKIAADLASKNVNKVLVTGGGAFNKGLMDQLKLESEIFFQVPSRQITEYKEALIFAFLGLLRLSNEVNVLQSYTNSIQNTVCGAVYLGDLGG